MDCEKPDVKNAVLSSVWPDVSAAKLGSNPIYLEGKRWPALKPGNKCLLHSPFPSSTLILPVFFTESIAIIVYLLIIQYNNLQFSICSFCSQIWCEFWGMDHIVVKRIQNGAFFYGVVGWPINGLVEHWHDMTATNRTTSSTSCRLFVLSNKSFIFKYYFLQCFLLFI